MLKKIYRNNLIIGMGIGVLIWVTNVLKNNTEYVNDLIVAIVIGGLIGIAIPFAHQFINPKKFITWYLLNFVVAYGILLLINMNVFTKDSDVVIKILIDSALKMAIIIPIPTWYAYSKYKSWNKHLKKKQEEFIKK